MTVYKVGKYYYTNFMIKGVRYKKSTGETTERKALQFEKAWRKEIREGRAEEIRQKSLDTPTLREALNKLWETRWKKKRDGQKSFNRVMYIVDTYGNPRLSEINAAWVTEVRQKLSEEGRTESTVNRYMAHLKTLLRTARDEWEVLDRVPKIKQEEETGARTRIITREEQEAVVKALRTSAVKKRSYDDLVADLVDFLCDMGLRLSEALSLEPINFQLDGHVQIWPPNSKNKKPRSVPMTDKAKSIIKKLGTTPFAGLDKFKADRSFNWAKKQLNITESEFCLHACRHTYASRILAKGADLYTVQRLLGHTSFVTTQRYAHMETSTLQDAVNRLN